MTPYFFSIGGCPFTSVDPPLKESTDNALTLLSYQGLFSKSIRGAETGHFWLISENFDPV